MVEALISASAARVVERWFWPLAGGPGGQPGPEIPGDLTPEVLDEIRRALAADGAIDRNDDRSRGAKSDRARTVLRRRAGRPPEPLATSVVGAVALSLDPDAVYRDSRRRINAALRLRWAFAIVLASVLVVGIAGVVATALVAGRDTATLVFGGMAFADVLVLALTRPFQLINEAHLDSTRLEVAFLRLRDHLEQCDKLPDSRQLTCRGKAWDRMQSELRALGGRVGEHDQARMR